LVTTPPRRGDEAPRAAVLVRGRDGRAGAFDLSSACSSRLQIGQLTVRRL
jgi:hypothetical protein